MDGKAFDGRVTELALGQAGRSAGDMGMGSGTGSAGTSASAVPAMQDAAFFLYNAMGDNMAMGVQTVA